MHNSILNIYIHKPDEGNKVTNGGHREVLLVFWTWARAQNHLEFGCKVLCDHYDPIDNIIVYYCVLRILLCIGLEQELKTIWSLVAESCVTTIILLTILILYLFDQWPLLSSY